MVYSLGDAVCVKTQWTDDASGLGDLLCEGEWVGHRFDMTTMGAIEMDAGARWKDVTYSAVARLEAAGVEPQDFGHG